jgi:hypothetical protein
LITDQESEEKITNTEEGKWFEFNDTIVQKFDPKDMASETFGGEEK